MLRTITDEPGKFRLEHDPEHDCYIMHWRSYHGPHYRKAIETLLAELGKQRASTYVSDASQPTDVQSQEDIAWIALRMQEMPRLGVKRVIVVQPASFIAKMGSKRMAATAASVGLQRTEVGSLGEAMALTRKAA